MILDNLISGLKSFEKSIPQLIGEVLKQNEDIIVDMNAEEQLFEQGKTREGVSIDSYAPYSPVTIEIKQAKGQPTNRVTLRDEGDFEASFFVQFNADSFEIKASDWKAANLEVEYGSEILGLTDENIYELVVSYVIPFLIEKMREL